MSGSGLSTLVALMRAAGVTSLYAKELAPNDNSKNQIYLGGNFGAVQILPYREIRADWSGRSRVLKAALDLAWLSEADGSPCVAPGAQLILYPQYPEVRMSGFLKNCPAAPARLLASRDPGRVLFLGVAPSGRVFATAVDGASPAAAELRAHADFESVGVFRVVPLHRESPRSELLRELGRVHRLGWIEARRRVAGGMVVACRGPNCGGYTLEAELGISANSASDPDFQGWEVKQHGVTAFNHLETGVITLMTPEPTGGYYREEGVESFIRRFGYADRLGRSDRLNFGGVHRVGSRHPNTGLALELRGFAGTGARTFDPDGCLALAAADGTIAASWSFTGLMDHWRRKHASAAYVPSLRQQGDPDRYHYGPIVRLGEGTDFLLLLDAMHAGIVYYDPGIKLEMASSGAPRQKRRSQFRVKSSALGALYRSWQAVPVSPL